MDEIVDASWDHLRGRPLVDRVFYGASTLGDFSLVWHLLGAVRALAPGRSPEEAVRVSATMGLESALVNGPVKSVFGRRRPPAGGHDHPHAVRNPRTSSFPSGHASAAFTAAALLGDGLGRPGRAAVYATAAIVSTSRIHVRMHHASDVAAGALLGIGLGVLARRLWALVPEPLGTRP
jgi:membrane-associated phospholipid phosphatase